MEEILVFRKGRDGDRVGEGVRRGKSWSKRSSDVTREHTQTEKEEDTDGGSEDGLDPEECPF